MNPIRSVIPWVVTLSLLALVGCGSGAPSNGGSGETANSDSTAAVSVDPLVTLPLPVGTTQQFSATVYDTAGTGSGVTAGVTWQSSNPSVATVDEAGTVTALAAGSSTITAAYGGVSSTGTPVLVTSAVLQSLSLELALPSLAEGLTTGLKVYGHYSDGTTMEITAGVTFSSGDEGVATVNTAGLVSGLGLGSAAITASYGGFTSNAVTISVTDAVLQSISLQLGQGTLALGLTTNVQVFGNYSDGTSVQLSSGVAFSSSQPGIASVNASGLIRALGLGSATITANYDGHNATADVGITSAVLQSLTLQAGRLSLIAGLTTQLSVYGNYSDGTSVQLSSGVTFSSGNLGLATVSSLGLVTGIGAGSVNVTASYGGKSATLALDVSAPSLASISVSIGSGSLAAGLTTQLSVTGHYDNGTDVALTSGVSFSVDTGSLGLVSVNASGVVSALATTVSPAVITASYGGKTATATLSVTNALLTSISLAPATDVSLGLPLGLTVRLVVTGHYSDDSTAVLSSGVTFSSLTPTLASVTTGGLVTSLLTGSATIKAVYGGQEATVDLTTTSPTLVGITATPGTTTLKLLGLFTTTVTVTGQYSNGSSAVISSGVNFTSSNTGILSVLLNGLVTGLLSGNGTITASYGGFTSTTPTITVSLL